MRTSAAIALLPLVAGAARKDLQIQSGSACGDADQALNSDRHFQQWSGIVDTEAVLIESAALSQCAGQSKDCTTKLGPGQCCTEDSSAAWQKDRVAQTVDSYTAAGDAAVKNGGQLCWLDQTIVTKTQTNGQFFEQDLKNLAPLYLPSECVNTDDEAAISKALSDACEKNPLFVECDVSVYCGKPPPKTECSSHEYCCPDAKACLTPVKDFTGYPVSCKDDKDACKSGQVCCPLTLECVTAAAACETPCGPSEFCCPEAKHCLTPVDPGVICADDGDCNSGNVCCPLIKQCVSVGDACTPP